MIKFKQVCLPILCVCVCIFNDLYFIKKMWCLHQGTNLLHNVEVFLSAWRDLTVYGWRLCVFKALLKAVVMRQIANLQIYS